VHEKYVDGSYEEALALWEKQVTENHICDDCGRRFRDDISLSKHIKGSKCTFMKHITKYLTLAGHCTVCFECNIMFRQTKHLRDHTKVCPSNTKLRRNQNQLAKPGLTPACSRCDRKFIGDQNSQKDFEAHKERGKLLLCDIIASGRC